MANVNITVQDGGVTINPWKVRINRTDLKIIWNLAAAGGWHFSVTPPGIVCELDPPPPYAPWDGTPAVPGPGPNQYNATGKPTAVPKQYKYSIHLEKGSDRIDIDPEIMNDP